LKKQINGRIGERQKDGEDIGKWVKTNDKQHGRKQHCYQQKCLQKQGWTNKVHCLLMF